MESDSNSLDPPPSYEQSLAAASAAPDPSIDDPSPTPRYSIGPEFMDSMPEIAIPTLAPTHAPSAPPLTLLRATSGQPGAPSTSEQPDGRQHDHPTTEALALSSPQGTQERRRGKQSARSKNASGNMVGANPTSGAQAAQGPSSIKVVQTNQTDNQYSQRTFSSDTHLRMTRRLQHKETLARHAASAPQLIPTSHEHGPEHPTPALPLSQSVIPAPPPRLLYFRSREPSAVPACPFLLCQRPISFTKTRRERGVTVWIVCGLLFLCNTYWTTQSVMAHFRPPSRDQEALLRGEGAEWASRSFSVQGEAQHLIKGLLGFKTYRYQDPAFQQHRRHLAELQRPTIATVGVLQDEQSTMMMVLGFIFTAVMAIIRWWLCLTSLLVRPLFDTVHSCPHAHPYPYPEELEQEQLLVEKELLRQKDAEMQKKSRKKKKGKDEDKEKDGQSAQTIVTAAGNDEKKQLQALVEEPDIDTARETTTVGQSISENQLGTRASDTAEALEAEVGSLSSSSQRPGFSRGSGQEAIKEMTEETVSVIKRLPWRMRRMLRKAEARRQKVVTGSQDIGRFSLLYELGALLFMDRWKQTVLMPGTRLQPDDD